MTHRDVRARRAFWGVSQAELADALGWRRQTMPQVESGEVPLSQEGYAHVLGVIERLGKAKPQPSEAT